MEPKRERAEGEDDEEEAVFGEEGMMRAAG